MQLDASSDGEQPSGQFSHMQASASGDGEQLASERRAIDMPPERRSRPVRYFFASAPSALLRLCLESLPGWREELSVKVQHAAVERWQNEKAPRCVLWLDKVDRTGRVRFQTTDINLGIQSRLDGMKDVANKSDMERCFVLCRDLGLQAFSFDECSYLPRTWLLPEQKAELEAHIRESRLGAAARGLPIPTYIVKPSGGSEGIGIFLLQHERLIPRYKVATIPLVVQDYIAPMLLDGKKFDFRLYVLIRSVDPLEVYLHCEGLARFCTEDYEPPTEENLGRSFAHLTNYSLNKASDHFVHLSESEVNQAASAAGDNDFLYAGCSKRPISEVMRDLEERGLVRERMLWRQIERLVALTALAIQPELALRYRARFPRAWPSETIAEAAAAAAARRHDLSHNAFHILGVDVLIDADGCPRLLEVNSKPSQGIDVLGSGGAMERSPVDVAVKTKIMTDMLAFAATGERSALLRPILSSDDSRSRKPPPPTTELLDRVRRVFDVIIRKNAVPGLATSHAEPEITSSKFTMFARAAGLHDLLPGSDLMLAFTRECRRQPETKAVANRSYQIMEPAQRTRSGHLPTPSGEFRPREQVQTRMRFAAFARTLSQIADQAFAAVHGPLPSGVSPRAWRLELLLNHMAGDSLPREATKPRTPTRSAQPPFACTDSRPQRLELPLAPMPPLAPMAGLMAPMAPTAPIAPTMLPRPPSAPPLLDLRTDALLKSLPPASMVHFHPRSAQRRRPVSAQRDYAPGLYASLIQANHRIARQRSKPSWVQSKPSWVHPKPIYFP